MSGPRPLAACAVMIGVLCLSACGKPEDARGYTPSADTSTAGTVDVVTPAPPVPGFAAPLMGHSLHEVSKGAAVCKGVLDLVTRRHTGPHPGSEMEGWAWDEHDAKPLDRMLIIDGAGKIVGGATVGNLRTDVPSAVPEVKTPKVGWKGVADVVKDHVEIVGVTANGATCTIGSTNLG